MDKKANDWAEIILAEEMVPLPHDEFTFTNASPALLDSYQFDTPENEGVLEGARLPEVKGLAKVPDGIVKSASEEPEITFEEVVGTDNGSHLGSMLSEGSIPKDASMTDFIWLDPTQEQDPNRLPKEPFDSFEKLEKAWELKTDGINLVPNNDKETAEYVQDIKIGPKSGLPGNVSKNAKEALYRASRMSHFGHSIEAIKQDFINILGADALQYKKAFDRIEAEHGLAGKVFIRASVFPGLKNGQWVNEIRKRASSARYVITDDQFVADKLAMTMVSDVPWEDAFEHYAPRLKAAGYNVPLEKDRQVSLRKAFLSQPVEKKLTETPKPVMKPVIASEEQTRQELERVANEPKEETKNPEQEAKEAKFKKAKVYLARCVQSGRISQADAIRIIGSTDDSYRALEAASRIMSASENKAVYDGIGAYLPKEAQTVRREVWANLEEREKEFEQGQFKKAQKYLADTVNRGLLTKVEAKRIASAATTSKELMGLVTTAIKAADTQRKMEYEASAPSKEYDGPVQKVAVMQRVSEPTLTPEMKRIMEAAEKSGIKSGEFVSMLRWARQQMSEGFAGKDLNDLLLHRFSVPLLKAASILLKDIRQTYEGLSGFAYVDAEAYATPKGITGCEKGALKHRANSLKYVLAMPRCATCTQKNADGVCQQYNKHLASEVPVENPKEYQKKAIRMANASDAEVTANLFNPSEFQLYNNSLDDIGFEDTKTASPIEKILFGGMDVETK